MKIIKILLSIVALLIGIAVIAVACLFMFMDPNQLKPVIEQEVQKQTGYVMAIDGKLTWTLYPKLGVKIARLTLRNPAQAAPFIELSNMTMATELKELIHGNQKLEGDIYVSDVKLNNLQGQDAHIGVHWQDKVLTLEPMKLNMYQGTVHGVAHANNLATMPKWDWNVEANGVQVKPLLADLNGKEGKITLSGAGHIIMQGATIGKSKDQMINNLNGSVAYDVKNGVVEGLDINYYLTAADALINKKPVPVMPQVAQTPFSVMNGSAVIQRGIFETNNTQLSSSTFATNSTGSVNLLYQALNLEVQIKSQEQLRTQWTIPLQITGSVANPSVRLDMGEIQKLVASQEMVKVKEKVRDKIDEHIKGKAGEFLKKLIQ